MLTAIDASGKTELCRESGQQATCPDCLEVVHGKCGEIVTPHFAHSPSSACPRATSSGETAWHREWKWRLAHSGWNLEVKIENHRADAVRGCQVVEIQRRPLPPEDYLSRTSTYGSGLVWLIDGDQRGLRCTEDGSVWFGSSRSLGWLRDTNSPVLIHSSVGWVDLVSAPSRRIGQDGRPYYMARVLRNFDDEPDTPAEGWKFESRTQDYRYAGLIDALAGAADGFAPLGPGIKRGLGGRLVICL